MARSDPSGRGAVRRARPAGASAAADEAVDTSDPELDRLSQPMPATTRLAEDPMVLPAIDGVAVRLPDGLKTRFKSAFPEAVWSRLHRLYLVAGADAKPRVEAWLARASRASGARAKPKPPPPLRLR